MPLARGIIRNPLVQSHRKIFVVEARNFRLTLGRQTKIMGILNITPDSFSGVGILLHPHHKYDPEKCVLFVQKIISDGADIIDIGGESTRPGSHRITAKEEIKRVISTLCILAKKIKIPISIDTYKETVAQCALDNGASIINNIMGVKITSKFLKMIKKYNAAIVLMHIRGTPQTMQKNIRYQSLIDDIIKELQKAIEKCLEIGIKSDKIIIDPGIGFGKTVEDNFKIIRRLGDFRILNRPILIGTSRKSFIGKILNRDITKRVMGTAATVCASILNGAHIVRVHDVKEIKDVVKMTDALLDTNP